MFQSLLTAAAMTLVCAVFPQPASGGQQLVAEALADLDRWLAGSRYGDSWHTYLKTDLLRLELARGGSPDLENLAAVLNAYASGARGLNCPQFVRTRRALEQWLALAALPRGKQLSSVGHSLSERYRPENGDPPARQFNAQVELLLEQLREYAVEPSAALADMIGDSLDWLGRNGQADSLVLAVKQYYGHPNVWIRVSQEALADRIERPFDRPMPVQDRILGTSIIGNGRSRGTTQVTFEPGDRQAVLNAVVNGTIEARTVGYNGPVRIHSVSVTPFVAEKRLLLSEHGLEALPAVSRARTTTVTTGIHSTRPGLRGRIVARIARQRVAKTKAQSDWIAARHAERQIRESIDEETNLMVRQLNSLVLDPLLHAARGTGRLSHRIQFRSAEGMLFVGLVHGPLGAPPGEPDWSGSRTLAVQLHSSALNWLLAGELQGRTMEGLRLADNVDAALGVPLFGDRPSLRRLGSSRKFAEERPFMLRLLENGLQTALGDSDFAVGEKRHEKPPDATAGYQSEEAPHSGLVRQALEFLRKGAIAAGKQQGVSDGVTDRTSDQASDRAADSQPTGRQRLLGDLVGQVLSEVIASQSIPLGGDKLGLGMIGQLRIRDDWLILGWNPPITRMARRLQ